MARPDLRHRGNADGAWYVDERCIDCGTCRDLAPAIFDDIGPQSVVASQPADPKSEQMAWLAAQACPTQPIGTLDRRPNPAGCTRGRYWRGYTTSAPRRPTASAPRPTWSQEPGGLLVDSPRFTPALVRSVDQLGGLAHVLLTHRDDVADAERWVRHFGARVWIHEDDGSAAPFATDLVAGGDPVEVTPGVTCIPVPGHTRGSVVWIVADVALTGESLAWSHERADLSAFKGACWYSWMAQLVRWSDWRRSADRAGSCLATAPDATSYQMFCTGGL